MPYASGSVGTQPEEVSLHRIKRARTARRAFFVALTLFLAAAAFNLFGVRTTTVSDSGGGYELSVRHASLTRPGLATPWSVEIRRDDSATTAGDEQIVLATKGAYFDAFDENGLSPSPEEETAEGDWALWTFKAPAPGDVLTVSFDARMEPGVQLTRLSGTTELRVGEATVASVDYKTFVFP